MNPTTSRTRSNALSNQLLAQLKHAGTRDAPREERVELLRALQDELAKNADFSALVKRDHEMQIACRTALVPLEFRKTFAACEKARANGRTNLLQLMSEWTDNRRILPRCAGAVHVAVCNYEMHQRDVVSKFQKIGDHIIRHPRGQPAKSAVKCLQHLKRNLRSTPYIWAKAWAAMSPAALDTLVLAHPGQQIPIFARTPPPKTIEPLLSAAIHFAARPASRTETKRDELLTTIFVVYRLLTDKKPPLSKSPRNQAVKFIKLVETAYDGLLPNGFNFPFSSHSTMERLRNRSLLEMDL